MFCNGEFSGIRRQADMFSEGRGEGSHKGLLNPHLHAGAMSSNPGVAVLNFTLVVAIHK